MRPLKIFIVFIFSFFALSANAQKDTSFYLQLGVYKQASDIHPLIQKGLKDLGFDLTVFKQDTIKNEGRQRVIKKHRHYKNAEGEFGYNVFYFLYKGDPKDTSIGKNEASILKEKFSSAIHIFVLEKDNEVLKVTKKPSFDAVLLNGINSFFGKLEFSDPFHAIGIYDPKVYDANGEPVIDKHGEVIRAKIPFIVFWLVAGAIFFTVFMKFINIRGFRHAIGLVSGKHDDPDTKGEVSHFQALATALSGTVGLGNIAGVAIAISMGGPGATFWMIVAGLLGMSSKFIECTLGVKYRRINKSGDVSGGPMYYLRDGLKNKGLGTFGMVLAGMFAVLCVLASFGGGNMFQANQAFSQFQERFSLPDSSAWIFGVILAGLTAIVIIGGIKSIAKVTEKIVPFMAVMYVTVALIIIFMNFSKIGDVFSMIFNGAFSADALKGGFIGVLILGFKRAAFSNEAGIGSASIAHSAVKTDKPVTEGYVSLLEPFIDTVIICTITALVIIITGYSDNPYDLGGAPLTSKAFESVFSWFPWLLMIAIILFAFSTMISWSYYGLKAWGYIFGESKISQLVYKLIFLVFIVIGASNSLNAVIDFSDLMLLGMAFPNIIGMYILAPEIKNDLKQYQLNLKRKK